MSSLYLDDVQISGIGGPLRLLQISLRFHSSRANLFVPWAMCNIEFEGTPIVTPFNVFEAPRFFASEQPQTQLTQTTLPIESLHFIESRRHNDVTLRTKLNFPAFEIKPDGTPKAFTDMLSAFGPTGYNSTELPITIPRSNWVRELGRLGWGRIELFEVSIEPLQDDKNLNASIDDLRHAQSSFLEGEYDATLTACAHALELASRVEIPGTAQKGFEALLFQAFKENDKRERLKPILESMEALCKLGTKDQYPRLPFSRIEAEFCLRTTLSLFSLLSHQLTADSD